MAKTYREIVYIIQDEMKILSDDSIFETDHFVFLANKYRALLFNQKYKGKKVEIPFAWYQRLNVNFTYPSIGSNIYKSTKQIPPVLDTTNLWQYTFISTSGANTPNLNFINPQRFKTCGYNKWTNNELHGTIDLDNYMYLKSKNNKYIDISQSNISTPFTGANTTLHPRWDDSGNAAIYGTDRFGFGALPSGRRAYNRFIGFGDDCSFIVNSEYNTISEYYFNITSYYSTTSISYIDKAIGLPIRAVRSTTTEEQLLPDGLIDSTYTDYNGNVYQCTKIGLQVWITSNLKVTHYVDGTLIPTNLSHATWAYDTDGACAVYGKNDGAFVPTDELDTESKMVAAYGRLYNWYAVDNAHGLIDTTDGWHIPTDAEFTQLTDYLIATYSYITIDNVGDVLKSVRQVNSPYSTSINQTTGSILYDTILDNPIDADRFNDINTLDVLDLEFPCEESLIQPIIDLCLKEISAINGIPRDATNNASDDSSLPKQQ